MGIVTVTFLCLVAGALVIQTTLAVRALEPIPEWLHICPEDTPDMAECITQSFNSLRPILGDGYAPLDLPSLNPFVIDNVVVSRSSGLTMEFNNLRTYDAHISHLSNLKVIEHGWHYQFDIRFPTLVINGTYHLSGQILLLQMNGRGRSYGRYENVTTRCDVRMAHRRDADGVFRPRAKSILLKTKVKKGKLRMDNLFGQDKQLGDALNNAINENFEVFASELLPTMDVKFGQIMRDYTNKLYAHFTSEQLYPGVDFEKSPKL